MYPRRALGTLAIAAAIGVTGRSHAQQTPQPDIAVTPAVRTEVIEGIIKRLNSNYVFPETAKKMEEALRKRVVAKEYDSVVSPAQLAERLTVDLQAVSHDKHLRVRYNAEPIKNVGTEPTAAEMDQYRSFARTMNYGFEKVERLEGNVGYLDLRGFLSPDLSGETLCSAMNFLTNADALIIDLRKNGGGDPATVQLLCSYLFGPEPVHLNDLYFRPSDSTQQYWTLPYVPGKRFTDRPVYVLTSHRTFSGAEECTYNLKNLKRATIVGETTGGGAHPGGVDRIDDHFSVFVPNGRAISPITKTNWEGTGVTPDVDVPAAQALATAHIAALKQIVSKVTDADRKRAIEGVIERLQKDGAAVKTSN